MKRGSFARDLYDLIMKTIHRKFEQAVTAFNDIRYSTLIHSR